MFPKRRRSLNNFNYSIEQEGFFLANSHSLKSLKKCSIETSTLRKKTHDNVIFPFMFITLYRNHFKVKCPYLYIF